MKKTGDEESVFQFQDFSHLMSAGGKSPDYEKEEENKTIRDVLQSGNFFLIPLYTFLDIIVNALFFSRLKPFSSNPQRYLDAIEVSRVEGNHKKLVKFIEQDKTNGVLGMIYAQVSPSLVILRP